MALGGEPQGLLSAADRALGDVDEAINHVRAMNLGLARPAGLPWKCAYFPMQNLEKITPNKSSAVNSPVISLSRSCASRSSSANRSS